jgi:predicted enzyme related to lactoylglutathione lyase
VKFEYVFGGLAVRDIGPAREWYERLFGRSPDLVPHEGEVCWNLTETGWIYVVEDRERAGHGLFTALVDDVDGFLGEISARGIEPGDREDMPGKARTAHFVDPDGNRIQIAQAA